jgi:cell division protease FtsH
MRPPQFTRLGRLLSSLGARVRRHPRLTIGFLVAVAVAVIAVELTFLAPRAPSLSEPAASTATYAGTWTLAELTQHADADELAVVGLPKPGGDTAGPARLIAQTRDGRLFQVPVTVDPGAAAAALASLGHGDLLSDQAWAAIRSSQGAVSSPSDPIRTVIGLVLPIAVISLLAVILMRLVSRASAGNRESASFLTILPRRTTQAAGLNGGAGPVDPNAAPTVRLDDVAGCEEAKLELTETIEFLKAPDRFVRLGARIPRGVMLYGPPGTGKTMLARAVAAEADVPFLAASGAEFIEKYVGVGSRRVRELFAQARGHGRAVVFIDEFDALGKARGGVNSHEEREQTLNQLLVELDGFTSTDGVVVIAATNRLDTLDPAVLRPGRFNRKIHVGLPDVAGRREILGVHARGKPLADDIDLDAIARRTYGFSGAQLADLLNEAAILAARRHGEAIATEDVHGGWLKVAIGTGRRRSMDERERSIIAAHEVGHAICGRLHGDKRRVEEISLFAHGEALGVTVSSQEDNDLPAESDLRARLIALMGGRAAEELLFHEVTGGAANDFEQANRIANTMVLRWGMGRDPEASDHGRSGRGALSFLVEFSGNKLPSEVQAAATRATRSILDEAYADACRTLVDNMELLRRLAGYLVEHERVDGETFDALIDGRIDVPNAHSEWRPATSRPRAWADIQTYHEGRRAPTPVLAAAVVVQPPTEAPVSVPSAPIPAPKRRSRSLGAGRPTLRGLPNPFRRRLRRLAVGYLDTARDWLRSSEGDTEA